MTPPNGQHTPDIGVSSPTESKENPATVPAHTSGGSSQDLKQEKALAKTIFAPTITAAAENAKATAAPQQQPAAAASTSRVAIIKAAGVPLGGRIASEGGPSKYRGVVWHKSNSKWEARIYEAGKQRFLGYFSNEDEAALTYDDHAASIHGTKSKLNFHHSYAGVVLPTPTRAAAQFVKQHTPSKSHPAAAAATGGAGNSRFRSSTTPTGAPHNNIQGNASEAGVAEASQAGKAFTHHQPHPHQRRGGGSSAARVQPVKGSSSFRGVSWNSNCHKWRAQVWKGAEVHHLGYFEYEEDAAHAYDQAVLRIRGPNAPTNYPRSDYGVYSDDEKVGEGHTQRVSTSNAGLQSFTSQNNDRKTDGGAHQLSRGSNHNRNSNKSYGNAIKNSPSSDMLGVSWSDSHKAWISEIWDGFKYQLLGTFTTESEAAKEYDVACLAQHGSDALTNFSLDNYPSESAAVALLSISHDPHGYEELYGGDEEEGRESRAVTPPALKPAPASLGERSPRQMMLHYQQQHYRSSYDANGLNNSNAARSGRQTVVIHNPIVNGAAGKRRASTPTVTPQKESNGDRGSASIPWRRQQQQQQQRASTPTISLRATPAPAVAPVPAASSVPEAAHSVINVEEISALYGRLQNCIAQQQRKCQTMPVLPLQSSAQPAGEAPEQHRREQQQRPVALSENVQRALMAIKQAALARHQQSAAAAREQEQYASQQRLEVAAAIQNWAIARQRQQIHLAPAPAAISLKRDYSNFSSPGTNNNHDNAMAAAYQALLAQHQMNAKRPRV